MYLKATLSFALLVCTVIGSIAGSVADAKQSNPLRGCSVETVELSPMSNKCVSPSFQTGTPMRRESVALNDADLVTCRPGGQQPPAFYPAPSAPAPLPPASIPVVSSIADNGIVGLFGLVVGAIALAIGGVVGHFKANDEDEKDAAYWESVRQSASAQKKSEGK